MTAIFNPAYLEANNARIEELKRSLKKSDRIARKKKRDSTTTKRKQLYNSHQPNNEG